jgi:hypothetical protein
VKGCHLSRVDGFNGVGVGIGDNDGDRDGKVVVMSVQS